MKTVDVRITDKQLAYLQKVSGRRAIPSVLSEMVAKMIDGRIWMEEHAEEIRTNGESTMD